MDQSHQRRPALKARNLARAVNQRPIGAGFCELSLRLDDVPEHLLTPHIEQMHLQVLVELEVRDQPMQAAPRGFDRLKFTVMQHHPHRLGDGRIDGGSVGLIARRSVLDNIRRDRAVDERVNLVCRRRSSRAASPGRLAEQSLEVVIPRRRIGAGMTKGFEEIQSREQPIRVEVVQLLKNDLACRGVDLWPETAR